MQWMQFPAFTLPVTQFGRVMLAGEVDPATDGPQVQALMQDHGNVIASHFHDVPQFQVVVGGAGFIGRHHMTRGMVRYVDRHRVYGPVRPDESGLVYLTLRREHDPGPHYMPDERDALAERRPVDPRGLGFDLTALDACWRDVAYRDADGLDVGACNLGRHEDVRIEMAGGGGFVVVIGGDLESASAVEACWLHAGETLEDRAGKSGARVLRLQFPR
jgi:hypothetical protein